MLHKQNVQNTQMQTCHYAIYSIRVRQPIYEAYLRTDTLHAMSSEVISLTSSEYQHLSRVCV